MIQAILIMLVLFGIFWCWGGLRAAVWGFGLLYSLVAANSENGLGVAVYWCVACGQALALFLCLLPLEDDELTGGTL